MDPYALIEQLEKELSEAKQEIERLGQDCVSELATRSVFEKHLETVFEARRSKDRPMGAIMVDIDHFKQVNDHHGHVVGDKVIKEVCRQIKSRTRVSDLVARYGGEEFVVVTTDSSLAGLLIVAERIRQDVKEMEIPGLPKVTISLGVTMQNSDDKSGWDIIERADRNLYASKNRGRNRVSHETLSDAELDMLMNIRMHTLVED